MIRRSAPRAFDQFHCAEFLNRNTGASWPANRLVGGHSRSFRRIDSTELGVARVCSSPIGEDKAAEGENRKFQLSDIYAPPLSR
jgi:hypothetical protein